MIDNKYGEHETKLTGDKLKNSIEHLDFTERYVTLQYRQLGLNYANVGYFTQLTVERPSGVMRDRKSGAKKSYEQ